ncbi:MAG: hypothetical protein PHG44_10020 [Lentisphaeria bacterium]|nr:hypothetical protein [Lentisphaeria bacterium]
MNGFSWLIINAVLLLGALGSWNLGKSLAHPELPAIDNDTSAFKESRPSRSESGPVFVQRRQSLPMDELWERSLFCPERTERSGGESESSEAESAPVNSEFELTGLAWIGLPGEAKPVAVIKQQAAAARRVAPRPGTAAANRTGGLRTQVTARNRIEQARAAGQRQLRADAPAAEPAKPQKLVFAVGDQINDSGYVLTEINTAENSVLLMRGAERLELQIEFGSAASAERKDVAVTEAASRARQREETERLRALAAQAASPSDPSAAAAANAAGTNRPPGPPGSAGPAGGRRRYSREQGDAAAAERRAAWRSRVQQDTATPAAGAQQPPAGGRTATQPAEGLGAQQQRLQQLYRESAERRARSNR